jgi:hypothetical protein
MSKSSLTSVLALASVLALPLGLSAQTLTEGTWGGSITQPDGAVDSVSFEVAYPGGELAITMDEGVDVPFQDVHFEGGSLRVSWASGEIVISCSLEPQADGSYDGDCLSPDGGVVVRMTMTPPGS